MFSYNGTWGGFSGAFTVRSPAVAAAAASTAGPVVSASGVNYSPPTSKPGSAEGFSRTRSNSAGGEENLSALRRNAIMDIVTDVLGNAFAATPQASPYSWNVLA